MRARPGSDRIIDSKLLGEWFWESQPERVKAPYLKAGLTLAGEKDLESMSKKELEKLAAQIQKKMKAAAAELNFEEAVVLRDQMIEVKKMLNDLL